MRIVAFCLFCIGSLESLSCKLYANCAGKRPSVGRWVRLHKAIGENTLAVVRSSPRLNSAYVLDNNFIVGTDSKMKLSDSVACKILNLLASEIETGTTWTAARFKSELCRPAKKADSGWKQITSKFGALATGSPFYLRVSENLFTVAGLQKVLNTMSMEAENLPLHGTSDQNPGVEECRKVVQELLKLKHPQEEKPKEQQQDITADTLDTEGPDGTLTAGTLPVLGLSPLETKAQTGAEAEMDKITKLGLSISSAEYYLLLYT